MDKKDYSLSTYDNPFSPFDEFEIWWKTDLLLGHDCCGLLARTANTNDVASDEVNDLYVLQAIDEIVRDEPMIYRKVTRDDYHQRAV